MGTRNRTGSSLGAFDSINFFPIQHLGIFFSCFHICLSILCFLSLTESVVLVMVRGDRRKVTGESAAWTNLTSLVLLVRGHMDKCTKPRIRTQVGFQYMPDLSIATVTYSVVSVPGHCMVGSLPQLYVQCSQCCVTLNLVHCPDNCR